MTKQLLNNTKKGETMIIALCGPSGIGKGFVKERLLEIYPFMEELSWLTTRPLRPDEQRGNRISVSPSEFERFAKNGDLVFLQNIYGYRYGLRRKDLIPDSRIKLTELHPNNVAEAIKIIPDIIIVGLVTFDVSLLHERLSAIRRTESPSEVEKRITTAEEDMQTILRQKQLFASVLEVSRDSESSITDRVAAILKPYLPQKGE